MTVDVEGNVYLTRNGVTVLDKAGEMIEQIDVPTGLTTSVTFGGKDRDLLFITTTDKYIYGPQDEGEGGSVGFVNNKALGLHLGEKQGLAKS